MARNAVGKTPWDSAQENEALKGTDAYWRLNEARFNTSGQAAVRARAVGQTPAAGQGVGTIEAFTGNVETGANGGKCEIPGYPSPPGGGASLGLAWCPASVGFQVRAFALQAAGIQCSLAAVPDPPPEVVNEARSQISEVCNRLAALGPRLGVSNCRCPAGYGP